MNLKKLFIGAILLLATTSIWAQANPLWMRYPSISPNGKTIVFNYMGDIYKVNTKGGEAIRLTTNSAYDYNAIWSPDGTTLAFASDRNGNFDIYLMSADGGTPKRLTTNSAKEIPSSFTPDGKSILFMAALADTYKNAMFPKSYLTELYSVSVDGGRETQIITTPAEDARYNKEMTQLIYTDKKAGENAWRKHHTSSVTRDIKIFDIASGKHSFLTSYKGEDRQPVYNEDESSIYYLSEKSGSFNIWKMDAKNPQQKTQITKFEDNPVRFLSVSDNNTLCYGFRGEIYTQTATGTSEKVNINIKTDHTAYQNTFVSKSSGASEMSVSPDGKEIAFIVRGEVYVTSVDFSTTKQITNTPEQERSVSFSPDGKSLVYASERNGSWNLYRTKIKNKEEIDFTHSTLLVEDEILANSEETFRPVYSPDGKEIAYLANRAELQVINLKSKKTRTILEGKWNYSYTDSDLYFEWSPDGKWFLMDYNAKTRWPNSDIGLIDAQGNGNITDLTNSGYIDGNAKWIMGGKAMIWTSDRFGMRNQASWGSQNDVFAMFFTQDAFDKFNMSKEEAELQDALDKENKKEEADKEDEKKDKKNKKDKEKIEDLKIDTNDCEDRITRLTINSSNLADAVMTPKGDKLYYLSKFEKGYDLWMHDFKNEETKKVLKLSGYSSDMSITKDGKYIFLRSGSRFIRIATANNKRKNISYKAEMNLNEDAEREYLFEHVWRQTKDKFYRADMNGVDWDAYKVEYKRFLPYINNSYDFAELLSELLGELNASHTGSGARVRHANADATAVLGVFFDNNYQGNGLRIAEIVDKSPLKKAKSKATIACILEKIDGVEITKGMDYYPLLNHKKGKNTLLSFYNPTNKERWDEVIKPISRSNFDNLLYERWVKQRRAETEKLSNGRIGYVHIKGMNDDSFRTVYSEVMGRYNNMEAIVVDTRYNGGGHMHEDIEVLFSGKKYLTQLPRGQKIGEQPRKRWKKPSIMLISEGNYSNAHGTPWVYKTMGLGKLVGAPVAGTMTSVWWETLMNGNMYFGIPQIGYVDSEGDFLENKQLEPDYKVLYDYDVVSQGVDQQLKKAVEVLLEELDQK
ncbi:S41 family peptidase [Ancylomarina sp. 16SWW S1-10-2]|uniref:S41 family peptidase n=1 Tax=Ancylomarina sp. 16SWW S1-10-2 TaxID=2499681 RepID=UPI0012AE2D7E|nr:S41 family peptidase [Ancylomarina sp. 16SWW S1-10-2]MRT94213.1 peptidase S41 [Ancylomarina sp. 16SWW S1-10-2]